jgi:drug/metabolite transporter (DMT)-like permease
MSDSSSQANSSSVPGQNLLRGALAGVLSAFFYATAVVFVHHAYRAGMSPLTTAFLRFATAFGSLFLFLKLSRRWVRLPGKQVRILFLSGLLLYAAMGITWFLALSMTPVWLVSLLIALFPIPVLLGSWLFLGAGIDRQQILALVIVLLGNVALFWRPFSGSALTGVALMALSVTLYATYVILGERWAQGCDPLMRTVWTTLGAMVGTGLYAAARQQLSLDFSPPGWLWAALLGIVCTVLAIAFLWQSVAAIGPGRTAILATLEPLFSVLLAIALLGERMSGLQWLGGIVILVGILSMQMKQ